MFAMFAMLAMFAIPAYLPYHQSKKKHITKVPMYTAYRLLDAIFKAFAVNILHSPNSISAEPFTNCQSIDAERYTAHVYVIVYSRYIYVCISGITQNLQQYRKRFGSTILTSEIIVSNPQMRPIMITTITTIEECNDTQGASHHPVSKCPEYE